MFFCGRVLLLGLTPCQGTETAFVAKRRAGANNAGPVATQEVLDAAKEATQAILAGDPKLQKDGP